MVGDALTCKFNDYHMGITAENVAERYNISREDQVNLVRKTCLNRTSDVLSM